MRTSNIYLSDLHLLIQLFIGSTAEPVIFDPFGRLQMDETMANRDPSGLSVLVNLGGELAEYKGMALSEFDAVIDLGQAKCEFPHQKHLNFVNHPSGKMRWLFEGNKLSSVLPFYNASGFRSKAIAAGIKLATFMGLGARMANGKITIQSKKMIKLDQEVQQYCEGYSVFMGTPGLQRSVLAALAGPGGVSQFAKIPATSEAAFLIQRERETLNSLPFKALRSVKTPTAENTDRTGMLIMNNLKSSSAKRETQFTPLHSEALTEMFEKSRLMMSLKESPFWGHAQQNTWKAKQSNDPQLQEISELLEMLRASMDSEDLVMNSMAHGDFTPWNMYTDKGKLALYDWELSRAFAPAFYDLFHFHYQQGILVDRLTSDQIHEKISKAIAQPAIADQVERYDLDMKLYHKLYLLTTVSYFAHVYSRQDWTLQNHWQLTTWKEALKRELAELTVSKANCRTQFIAELNEELNAVPHAFLKFDFSSLDAIPEYSDLDIAMEKKHMKTVAEFCENHPLIARTRFHKKSFMTVLELHFRDGSYLSIDLIHRFMRKHLTMLDAQELIASSVRSSAGVMSAAMPFDLAYAYAFYTLNNASVPVRYYGHFKTSAAEEEVALELLNSRFGTAFQRMEEVYTRGREWKPVVEKHLRTQSTFSKLKGAINYALDTLRDLTANRGFMVTFSGVDGAGKSTVIEQVKTRIEQKYRKDVVLLRHRPGILPILSAMRHGKAKAEEIAGTVIPRKGGNEKAVSSLLRFSYYFADYLIGQVYVNLRYIARGKVVLYDRYYFDFINDAKRSNIQLNPVIARSLYRFIVKPRLNIFLYADAETILTRKQELEMGDIVELTSSYQSLFDELEGRSTRSSYRSIENVELEDTVNSVLKEFERVA